MAHRHHTCVRVHITPIVLVCAVARASLSTLLARAIQVARRHRRIPLRPATLAIPLTVSVCTAKRMAWGLAKGARAMAPAADGDGRMARAGRSRMTC